MAGPRSYLIRTVVAREARGRIWALPRKRAVTVTDRAERVFLGRRTAE